jgi:hypothetical protein
MLGEVFSTRSVPRLYNVKQLLLRKNLTEDRPVLSSERAPHKKQDRNCQRVINVWPWVPSGARHQDLLTDRQSQCDFDFDSERIPCKGGVEYLHRSPASRRRWRKGESRIWDSKIWSRVSQDSDQRMTELARASSNCKRQTRPLVSKSPQH